MALHATRRLSTVTVGNVYDRAMHFCWLFRITILPRSSGGKSAAATAIRCDRLRSTSTLHGENDLSSQ